MHDAPTIGRARQSGRANSRGVRAPPESEAARRPEVRLYKNNTDFVGHSYGCHDNYLMRRDVPWDRLVAGVLPFLVTRQIFAGAGKMGIEAESAAGQPGVFQISQRADFFSVLVSIDTMNRRPLVNTRDEPHADANRYRRFHVIIGDSNMSEWATAMKVGNDRAGARSDRARRSAADRNRAADRRDKSISRDQNYDWIIELTRWPKDFRDRCAAALPESGAESLCDWRCGNDAGSCANGRTVLNDLERDVALARDRVDWVAKKFLLRAFQEEEKLVVERSVAAGDRPRISQHHFGPGTCIYELLRQGSMRSVVREEEIKGAIFAPPETTRAYFRGRSVARFNNAIASIQWDEIVFRERRAFASRGTS